jgi:hypothetical protein
MNVTKTVDKTLANGYFVPECAMQVARTDDLGAMSAATGQSCTCFYESLTDATGTDFTTNCTKTCATSSDCTVAGTTCVLGYCEATGNDSATAGVVATTSGQTGCTSGTVAAEATGTSANQPKLLNRCTTVTAQAAPTAPAAGCVNTTYSFPQ